MDSVGGGRPPAGDAPPRPPLDRLLHPEASIDDLGRYHRQYVGVGARRLIYVNAFPLAHAEAGGAPVVVCDGGPSYWGALFDPETGTFSDLAFNGEG